MNCALNNQDYVGRKLAGENVISPGSLYGCGALTNGPETDEFIVLNMNIDTLSFYRYAQNAGRIRILESREDDSHELTRLIDAGTLFDSAVNKWWSCVFFERGGRLDYDAAYDTLLISDTSDIPFRTILDGISELFKPLLGSSNAAQAFIQGELCQSLLIRHVLQRLTGLPVKVLPATEKEASFSESDLAAIPEEKLGRLSLNAGSATRNYQKSPPPLTITLPVSSLESELMPGIQWGTLLSDANMDYSVGDMGFKLVKLLVEWDAYQNVFLSCRDTRGNQKIIQY